MLFLQNKSSLLCVCFNFYQLKINIFKRLNYFVTNSDAYTTHSLFLDYNFIMSSFEVVNEEIDDAVILTKDAKIIILTRTVDYWANYLAETQERTRPVWQHCLVYSLLTVFTMKLCLAFSYSLLEQKYSEQELWLPLVGSGWSWENLK